MLHMCCFCTEFKINVSGVKEIFIHLDTVTKKRATSENQLQAGMSNKICRSHTRIEGTFRIMSCGK
jgi:O-acetylhomoserine/O-acetylserine sulfhydrylase-like pyridoxal-dependent enzyme